MPANLAGIPVMGVPFGISPIDGYPIGLQLMIQYGEAIGERLSDNNNDSCKQKAFTYYQHAVLHVKAIISMTEDDNALTPEGFCK
ncbi:14721_t:CDS:2, partial [Cetraspora pellucida]